MNKIIIVLLGLLLMTASCKKDKNTTWQYSNSFSQERIKTESTFLGASHLPAVNYYAYDDQGRIISKAASHDTLVYDYNGNLLTVTETGSVYSQTIYFLNINGLADSSHSESGGIPYYRYFYYDVNQQLNKIENNYDGQPNVIYLTYQDGNEIGFTGSTLTNTVNRTETFYTDKESSISNENFGMIFQGRNSVDLIKSYTDSLTSSPSLTCKYRYYYDTKGRVSAAVQTTNFNNYDSVVYTYY